MSTDVTGYKSSGLRVAVALVNHADDPAVALDLAPAAFPYRSPLSAAECAELCAWAQALRGVFTAADLDAAVTRLNGLLGAVTTRPHIHAHDGTPPHLHFSREDAPVVQRVQAATAMALATLVCGYGLSRLGVCGAAGCEDVYVDVSRNAQRRFCSPGCANRTNVAAFRQRTRT